MTYLARLLAAAEVSEVAMLTRSRFGPALLVPLEDEDSSTQYVQLLLDPNGLWDELLAHSNCGLTAAQRRVASLLARRCTNREIAEELGISCATARRHTESVMRRLGVTRRAEVISVLAERIL